MHPRGIPRLLSLSLLLCLLAVPALAPAECGPGDKAEVLWKGTWYPATVLHGRGERCFIQYDGYDASWNEWVGPDRIRLTGAPPKKSAPAGGGFREGDPVQVLWKGGWYDAHVLKTKGTQTFIHYDGYARSWDEWVGPDRIRPREGTAPPAAPPPAAAEPAPAAAAFDASGYTCEQFLRDSQAKAPAAARAIDHAIAYFGQRSGKSMAGMDATARQGFEMVFALECPAAPQTAWDAMVQKVYETSGSRQ